MNLHSLSPAFFCSFGSTLIVCSLVAFPLPPPLLLAAIITWIGRAGEELFLGLSGRVQYRWQSQLMATRARELGSAWAGTSQISTALTLSGRDTSDHRVLNTSGRGVWHHPRHLWGIRRACRPIPLWPYKDSLKSNAPEWFSGQLPCSFILEEMEGDNQLVRLLGPQRQMDSAFESAEAKRPGLRGPWRVCFSSTHCPYKTFPGSRHCCLDGLFSACCLSCLAVVCQDAGFLNAFPAGYLSGG